jgi:heme oxygenase
MITDQLKKETLTAHQQLEKLLVYRIRSINSVEKYIALLKIFYGFYQPLEGLMEPLIHKEIIPDYDERRKSAALLEDIRHLLQEDTRVILCPQPPAITNTGAALGALYVLEGSTLGGAIIAKMIRTKISGLPGESLRFFTSYGEQTTEKWAAFRQALNAWATTQQQKEAIIFGANETFQQFHNWINIHQTTATDE